MIDEYFYKLRNKTTGLFRHKGMWARWDKKGDRWSTVGHIKQHLSQFPADKIDWENWEIVEYRYVPQEWSTKTLKELL